MAAQSTYSLAFANATDYVTTSSYSGLVNTVTMSGWFRLTSASGTQILMEQLGGSGDWGLCAHNGALSLLVIGVSFNDFTTLTLSSGVWFHVGITVSGSTAICYLNGVSQTISVTMPVGTPNVFRVGAASSGLIGSADDVAVLPSILTPTQMANIAGTPGVSGSSSLNVATLTTRLLWRMEEGSGTTTADTSGNGYTGTLNGGITWSALNDVPAPLQAGGGATVIPFWYYAAQPGTGGSL